MSYTPNIWVDREGTTRYFETIDTDGAKIFTPDYSQLTEIGTPVNADHMNHIEEGIAAGSFTKYNPSTTYKQNDLVTFFEDGKLKVYKSLKDENTNNEVANENYWEEVKLGGGSSLPIGSTVVLDKVLSFEESQGLALQGTYVYKTAVAGERYGYPDFYNEYVDYKNNATATQTTLGSSTITIYNNANGLKFYNIADKGVIDTFFNSTGVADFYGVDEENERIFLPRNNKFWQFTTNTGEVNNYLKAGLPNITGSFASGGNTAEGAMYVDGTRIGEGGGAGTDYNVIFNASRSSSVYGNSNTVQPASSKKLLYYVVGNTTSKESLTEVVAQGMEILEQVNQGLETRVKLDASNLSTDGRSLISGYAFPSNKYINLTLGASGSAYTAPANGYFAFSTTNTSSANNYTYLRNETAKMCFYAMANAGVVAEGFLPVKKGDIVTLGYFSSIISAFRFIYAEGEV